MAVGDRTVTGTVTIGVGNSAAGVETESGRTNTSAFTLSYTKAFTSGTGSGQIDELAQKTLTLAAAANELDIAGDLTSEADATAVSKSKVKALIIENLSVTLSDNLTVGGAAENAWEGWTTEAGSTIVVPGGGALCLVAPGAGYTVTAETGDILKLDPGAETFDVRVTLLGVRA